MESEKLHNPFIIGDRVYLRPLERSDINERYLYWLNDPEVNRYLETGVFPQTLESLERFYENQISSHTDIVLAIIDKEKDVHIGNIKLGPINWIKRRSYLGMLVGDKNYWGKGLGTEIRRLMVEYAFYRLNLHRIDSSMYAEHKAIIRVNEKLGFKVEGIVRECVVIDGKYSNGVIMGLLRSEYKRENE
ncbi:MAG: GNAT family protein [Candidatus Hatepunaea meridiana]|nr:GNAT family protein [Candidatus Hatepunaea meridiana]